MMDYFFETDYIKLRWDTILYRYPEAVAVTISKYGDIAVHFSEPRQADVGWVSPSMIVIAYTTNRIFELWQYHLYRPPNHYKFSIPKDVKAAIRVIFPAAKWIVQDEDGRAWAYSRDPVLCFNVWMVDDMWEVIAKKPQSESKLLDVMLLVPVLYNYAGDNWRESKVRL